MLLTEPIVDVLNSNKDNNHNIDSAEKSPSKGILQMHSAVEISPSVDNKLHVMPPLQPSAPVSDDNIKSLSDKGTMHIHSAIDSCNSEYELHGMSTLRVLSTLHTIHSSQVSTSIIGHVTELSHDVDNDIDLSMSNSSESAESDQMQKISHIALQKIDTNYAINEEQEVDTKGDNAVECTSESDDYDNAHTDVTHNAYLREECNEIRKGFTNNYLQFKWKKLIQNRLFYTRIPTCLIAMLLLFVSVTYCIGQTYETQLDLITKCSKPKSREEIWKHSQEAQLRHNKLNNTQITLETQWGWTDDECWSTKKSEINEKTLWFSNKYMYQMVHNPLNPKTILFAFVSVYCLIVIFYGIVATMNDVIDVRNNALHKRSHLYRYQNNHNSNKRAELCWVNIKKWYNENMATDTSGWVVMMVMFELIEIIVQYQALLLYNGYNVFDKHNEDNIYLANKPDLILVFAVILAFNCIASGICWLCYTLCNNECHGLCFKLVLLYVDQVSDFLYTIFPYIVIFADGYTQNPKDKLVWIAQLNIHSNLAFVAAFIPLLFLCNKCLFIIIHLVHKLRDEYYEKWQFIQCVLSQTDTKLIAYQAQLRGFKHQKSFNLATAQKEIFDHQGNIQLNLKTVTQRNINKVNWVKKSKKSGKRRACLVIMSLLYFCLAIQIFLYTTTYIDEAQKYCYQIDESKYFDAEGWFRYDDNATFITEDEMDLMASNPELFLWDKCLYKVYPFSGEQGKYKCECRVFVIDWETDLQSTSEDRFVYFNVTQPKLLTAMLQHWNMLEKFSTAKAEDSISDSVDFEQNMINARMLRAFSWDSLSVTGIDEGLSMKLWSELEYFRIENTQLIQSLPSDFDQLHSLKYFKSVFSGLQEFPQQLCSLDNLKIIHIEFSLMSTIPHCVAYLVELEQFHINVAANLAHFPVELLSLPKLEDVSLWKASALTYENLLAFNNISNVSDFNKRFKWNNYTNYYLSLTPLCDDYNISKLPMKLQLFLSKTNSNNASTCDSTCFHPDYDDYDGYTQNFCQPSSIGDGKCDFGCNTNYCSWDLGDCVQLCFNSPFSNCTWDLFMNEVCDVECNNIYCSYVHFGGTSFESSIIAMSDNYNCNVSINASVADEWETVCYESRYDNIYTTEYNCSIEMAGDGWCDDACRTDGCENDKGDCETVCMDDPCNLVLNAWSFFSGGNTVYLVSELYVCDIMWPTIQTFFEIDMLTCEYVVKRSDINNDGYINFREFVIASRIIYLVDGWDDVYFTDHLIYTFATIDSTVYISQQVNCSSCVGIENYNIEYKP